MKRPVCSGCQKDMHCEKNGVYVIDCDETGAPYQIFHGDKYDCTGCGIKVVVGFGQPIGRESKDFDIHLTIAKADPNMVWVDPREKKI